jgi:dTDP-4-dehydrorhamnose reductase
MTRATGPKDGWSEKGLVPGDPATFHCSFPMIYLLGGSGYVGQAYQALLSHRDIPYRNIRRADLDYTSASTLAQALRRERPEFLINAAGFTGKPNVDACELHKHECLFGNAVLPGRIADACAEAGVPWGHVSSGCIYSGARPDGRGFTEIDPPNFTFRFDNCSFYSGSKGLGEEVLAGKPNVYIWRLRIPFNEVDGPRNYLSKLMRYDRLLEATNSISQIGEFCAATLACWEKRVPFGIYNVTNPGRVTTHEVVDLIRQSGVSRKEFAFFKDEDEFMHTAAKTPRSNCVMDSSKLAATGIAMTEVHEAIRKALRHWRVL